MTSAHKTDSANAPKIKAAPKDLSLSYARTLSWLSLVLILTTSLGLSVLISNSARESLLIKQEDFANLLAKNLNHQIYQRFTVPTVLAYGRVALRQTVQYERLDTVVRSVTHGLELERVRIYDYGQVVGYSTDNNDLGRTGVAPIAVTEALRGQLPKGEIISSIPLWQAPFSLPLEPGTFVLRTVYPLTGEVRTPEGEVRRTVMGALELNQDITKDYASVIAFQWLVVGMCLLSSVVLFSLLLVLIRRAERVLAERMAKNKALEDELHSKEKFVSMGRVIASIAHEIRNPLGIIRSSAEFLQKRNDQKEQTDIASKRILGAIYDESKRLSQTINDFLDYARPRQPQAGLVDMDAVLDQAMAFLGGEFDRHSVSVERNLSAQLFVVGDKDLLYRAVYNILVNAQQAMDGPGIITVEGHRKADTVHLSFTDTGPGFQDDSMENMFDPFFTTKESGTGLGLAIVKSIIESHGGSIGIANVPDMGAQVNIILKAFKGAPGLEETEPADKNNASYTQGNLLE